MNNDTLVRGNLFIRYRPMRVSTSLHSGRQLVVAGGLLTAAVTAMSIAPGEAKPGVRAPHQAACVCSASDSDSVTSSASDSFPSRLILARSKRDSTAYQSTIAFGLSKLADWPAVVPADGSVLPSHRIIAFYGTPLNRGMGILGQYAPDRMLAKLDTVVADWQRADPTTQALPALHLIAVTAQRDPGRDGMYRLRIDSSVIEKVYGWAQQRHALLFLDLQVGHSTVQKELPRLMPFLSRPDVHLAIDPEFSMHHRKEGIVPGKRFGQTDAAEINWLTDQLAKLVTEQHLPPKVLVVHRFRPEMVSNAAKIHLDPNVQIVMDMDGFGPPWQKFESYRDYILTEPVEFTGFKLFYRNDTAGHRPLLTPCEILGLRPRPVYIQYQ
jgi:hypothetical protein